MGVNASRVLIDRLIEASPDLLDAMVAESEGAGCRFVRQLADEWASGTNRFDRPGEVLFAAHLYECLGFERRLGTPDHTHLKELKDPWPGDDHW